MVTMDKITLSRSSNDMVPSRRILTVLLSLVLIGTFNINTTRGFKMNPPDYPSTSKKGISITNNRIDLRAEAKLERTQTSLRSAKKTRFQTTVSFPPYKDLAKAGYGDYFESEPFEVPVMGERGPLSPRFCVKLYPYGGGHTLIGGAIYRERPIILTSPAPTCVMKRHYCVTTHRCATWAMTLIWRGITV